MPHILLYCRPGFEAECATEVGDRAATQSITGHAVTEPRSGYVVFTLDNPEIAPRLMQRLDFRDLIFARQWVMALGPITDLQSQNRIAPLLSTLSGLVNSVSTVFVETADTDTSKPLLNFCRKFARPLEQALQEAGYMRWDDPHLPRLHVFFPTGDTAYLGLSWPDNASPWFMGIPRLRLPRDAPSRAALKLEEAFHVFLSSEERTKRLRPGLRAVDLGAAPGGWSWQLTRRHLRVTAVDNGPLAPSLLASGLVEHRREDGFRYRPRKPVDWLVCDIADKPARTARLIADWMIEKRCRESIFNLKLPMKRRYATVLQCRELIEKALQEANIGYRLVFKQLYHDREEITGHLRREAAARGFFS